MSMNIYEETFHKLQHEDRERNDEIITTILQVFSYRINGFLSFPENYRNTDKIFYLLTSEWKPYLIDIIEQFNYSYHAELQFIIANLCFKDNIDCLFGMPSLIDFNYEENGYSLNTLFGKITLHKALNKFPNLYNLVKYGECHNCCLSFIKENENMSASTCLIDRCFYGNHYHSFINFDEDTILDLSHNAIMSKRDYNLAFAPKIINTVYGYEVDNEEKRINNKESLGQEKNLLLRLALDKQVNH